jgi:hypothetical protein
MTTSITRKWTRLVLLAGLLAALAAGAEDSPHWDKTACQVCHTETAPVAGQVTLKAADTESLCESCHGSRGDATPCRHASGVPSGDFRIAEELQPYLEGGQVVCSTCHDVVYQCENPSANHAARNRGFLRSRQSYQPGAYCLRCHESSQYSKLNPHSGVTEVTPRPTCQLCHTSIPETSTTGELVVEFNMQHDLNDMCFGCHQVKPHPVAMTFGGGTRDLSEWVHFVQPSDAVLETMREVEAKTGIRFPLNPLNGEVFCATCHNPHEFISGGENGTFAPTYQRRLRLPNICQACHAK